jgi:hypothetical protein
VILQPVRGTERPSTNHILETDLFADVRILINGDNPNEAMLKLHEVITGRLYNW